MERNQRSQTLWTAGPHTWDLSSKALIMGILNVTPDSFSDGGQFYTPQAALAAAHDLIEQGADIIDIGGESTRPGADTVTEDEEAARVLPVIKELASSLEDGEIAISIDTCKPSVAKAALQVGATIVNDISGLRDPEMVSVCAQSNCGIVLMHMQGTPQTMQNNPNYQNVTQEIRHFFEQRCQTLEEQGIARERIICDPGIGFGKTLEHNLSLLKGLPDLIIDSRPVLIGLSRKSFIGAVLQDKDLTLREAPSQTLSAYTRSQGAMIHRVHQVAECKQAIEMVEAIAQAPNR